MVAVVPAPRQMVDYARLGEVAGAQRNGYGARALPLEAGGGVEHTELRRAGGSMVETSRRWAA